MCLSIVLLSLDFADPDNLPAGVRITSYDLRHITLAYGPDHAYLAGISYRRAEEDLVLYLGGVGQYEHSPNPHTILRDILQKELNQHRSLLAFIQTLLHTLDFAQSLNRVPRDLVLMQGSGSVTPDPRSGLPTAQQPHVARPLGLLQLSALAAILVYRNRFALRITFSPKENLVELEDAHRMFANCEPMPAFEVNVPFMLSLESVSSYIMGKGVILHV